jgi:hypothetical protein
MCRCPTGGRRGPSALCTVSLAGNLCVCVCVCVCVCGRVCVCVCQCTPMNKVAAPGLVVVAAGGDGGQACVPRLALRQLVVMVREL